jgi:large subunit ribosomal protein L7/L12
MADEENNNEKNEEEKEEDEDQDEEEQEEEEEEEEGEDEEDSDDDEDEESEEGGDDEDDENDEDEETGDDESEEDDEGDKEMDGEDVEVPEKFADIVEEIEEMPVVELNELVSLLEKKWGVSAQAVAAAGGGGGGDEEEEEKDAYDAELTDFGDSKISVIKAVKAGLGLGLKEAKGMVEDAPVVLKEGMDAEEAEELKENIEEEGGTVELK